MTSPMTRHVQTALMYAARGGHATVLRRLLEPNGVNVDERNKEHATALYIACREGHTECVRLLVEAGADVNITTKTRRRPLHWYDTTFVHGRPGPHMVLWVDHVCSASMNNHVGVARLLLEHGAEFEATDVSGLTAWHEVAEGGHMECLELFLALGYLPHTSVGNLVGRKPLHFAVMEGHLVWVTRALDACDNAGIDDTDNEGCTPAYFAASRGHVACLRELLRRGADVTKPSSRRTPLHSAAVWGHEDCVSVLLAAGADPAALDASGLSPAAAARAVNQIATAALIEGHMQQ